MESIINLQAIFDGVLKEPSWILFCISLTLTVGVVLYETCYLKNNDGNRGLSKGACRENAQ